MKKMMISLLSLLAMSLGAQAQTLSVEDVEALSSGETVKFNLHAAGITAMTSMHFEVAVHETFAVTKVERTTAWDGAMFSREGGVISAMSSSDDAFNGEGDVATVSVTVPAETVTGTYPVTISEIRINGENYGSSVEFDIKVVDKHTVILDETSTTPPSNETDVNVTVRRTIKGGNWSTICLPFAVPEAQMETAFGAGVQLADFTGIESTTDGDNITAIQVNFDDATEIEANHPYLIKVSNDISEFTVTGVDIEVSDDPSVNKDELILGSGKPKDPYRYLYNSFIGTYVANTSVPEYGLFLSNNQFWYSAGVTTMKAYRAYFDFYDVLTDVEDILDSSSAPAFSMSFGGATGVKEVKRETKADNRYYTLSGQRVESPRKGLYIVNNKKVVVR